MTAPAAVRNAFQDFYFSTMLPQLDVIFDSSLERHPDRRPELLNMDSVEGSITQFTEVHDLPLFTQVSEGQDFTFSSQKQGASKTLTVLKFGLGFSISQEMIEDGKFNFVADAVRKLGESGRESQEVSAMNMFNNGFGSETTADTLSIFNTAHTLPGGTTFSNRAATDVDLSQSSLQQGLIDFKKNFVGDTGIIKFMQPMVLLVPTELEFTAEELTKSLQKPGSADNDINVIQRRGLRVVSSPHLTDTDAWFLISSPDKQGIRVAVRKPLQTQSDSVFINDSVRYKSSYREIIGADHPYGLYGTSGG